jgi:hypothetical protein
MRVAVQVCSDSAIGVKGCDVAAEEGDASYEADGARGEVLEVWGGEAGGAEGVCHFAFVSVTGWGLEGVGLERCGGELWVSELSCGVVVWMKFGKKFGMRFGMVAGDAISGASPGQVRFSVCVYGGRGCRERAFSGRRIEVTIHKAAEFFLKLKIRLRIADREHSIALTFYNVEFCTSANLSQNQRKLPLLFISRDQLP